MNVCRLFIYLLLTYMKPVYNIGLIVDDFIGFMTNENQK